MRLYCGLQLCRVDGFQAVWPYEGRIGAAIWSGDCATREA